MSVDTETYPPPPSDGHEWMPYVKGECVSFTSNRQRNSLIIGNQYMLDIQHTAVVTLLGMSKSGGGRFVLVKHGPPSFKKRSTNRELLKDVDSMNPSPPKIRKTNVVDLTSEPSSSSSSFSFSSASLEPFSSSLPPSSSSSSSPSPLGVESVSVWRVMDDKGDWQAFDEGVQGTLEQHFHSKSDSITITEDPYTLFSIDLQRYTRINAHILHFQDSRFRLIQRLVRPKPRPTVIPTSETSSECVVCLDHPKGYVFSPCRHVCVCPGCAKHLDKCPVCCAHITSGELVYL